MYTYQLKLKIDDETNKQTNKQTTDARSSHDDACLKFEELAMKRIPRLLPISRQATPAYAARGHHCNFSTVSSGGGGMLGSRILGAVVIGQSPRYVT
jgi:hypothetical protein